jgi:hypothetical protein
MFNILLDAGNVFDYDRLDLVGILTPLFFIYMLVKQSLAASFVLAEVERF